MKSLRRSLINGREKDHSPNVSPPTQAVSKPQTSIKPPNKVIRALGEHRPQAPNELGFQKGDFFYVVSDQSNGWYEANNPMTGARGLVPKSKFEEFNKANAAIRASQAATARNSPLLNGFSKTPPSSPRQPVFYAIVQHDFIAERADELDAKSGDNISIVAQSNFEWFVAKPISRLGRPGLIPVSFVSIIDPATGNAMTDDAIKNIMLRGEVPGVEEWKKAILEYKATSISLGVIDDDSSKGPVPNSPFMPSSAQMPSAPPQSSSQLQNEMRAPSPPPCLPPGLLVTAEVVSWHFEMEEYWFRINATFQPESQSGSSILPPAKQLILFRVYNDFYDFQVELLNAFPFEAGRAEVEGTDGQLHESSRILPYMPGPAPKVDDKVTIMRREELDTYLVQLCGLWQYGAHRILRHQLIREFFAPKAGDMDEDVELPAELLEERFGKEYNYDGFESNVKPVDNRDQIGQLRHPFAQMSTRNEEEEERLSDGSTYDEENDMPPMQSRVPIQKESDRGSRASSSLAVKQQTHQRNSSASSTHRDIPDHYPHASTSRNQSPIPDRRSASGMLNEKHPPGDAPSLSRLDMDLGQRQVVLDSPGSYQSNPPLTAVSGTSSFSRNRSASNANNPPISASNPNTAFVKIKIFDRLTQELIAIRVNPKVTHEQLMDKVRARLGGDVQHLAFRNSLSNEFLGVDNDRDLKNWLDGTDKHVLYAD